MTDSKTLNHTEWECKYHVVFIPKYRRKVIYRKIRSELKDVFRRLALQKESEIEAGHLEPDHVHMMIAIPPKYLVSQVIGFIKGKSAIHIARTYGERKRGLSRPGPARTLAGRTPRPECGDAAANWIQMCARQSLGEGDLM